MGQPSSATHLTKRGATVKGAVSDGRYRVTECDRCDRRIIAEDVVRETCDGLALEKIDRQIAWGICRNRDEGIGAVAVIHVVVTVFVVFKWGGFIAFLFKKGRAGGKRETEKNEKKEGKKFFAHREPSFCVVFLELGFDVLCVECDITKGGCPCDNTKGGEGRKEGMPIRLYR